MADDNVSYGLNRIRENWIRLYITYHLHLVYTIDPRGHWQFGTAFGSQFHITRAKYNGTGY